MKTVEKIHSIFDTLFSKLRQNSLALLLSMRLFPALKWFYILLIFFTLPIKSNSQNALQEKWVDSVFKTLTPDQRIAQLLMIRGYSNRDSAYVSELYKIVTELKIGGVCFFQGGPVRQAIVTNQLQSGSAVPLFIAIDAEWGLGMRLDSTMSFPKQMTLGAIRNDQYIYELGTEVARHLKRLGIHMNFAPVADINNNPNNPVINARSFGENRLRVSEKSYFYMKGMQDSGIIAVGKHFPGHGDTDIDSHYSLPIIEKSRNQIDSVELYPFKYLIDRGIQGIMVSHLRVPALDTSSKSIATLSRPILTDLLRTQMGFTGIIITDGMDMKGLVDFSDIGKVEADALLAGNDILLLPVDARIAIENIRKAIDEGYLTQELIDEKCLKTLNWKYKAGLHTNQIVPLENIAEDLNKHESKLISIYANSRAITLLENKDARIPVMNLDELKIASLVIGDTVVTPFQQMLSNYAPVTHFNIPKDASKAQIDSVGNLLHPYNLILAAFLKSSDLPAKRFNVTAEAAAFVDSLALYKKTVLSLFASPYSLAFFKNTGYLDALLVSYQDNANMQELTAQAIFGGRTIDGVLPVTPSAEYAAGDGLIQDKQIRIAFAVPEEVMVATNDLSAVDSIMYKAIDDKVFPGGQIVVIRNGKVIINKAYGTQTFETFKPLDKNDLFDLASLTKVLGTSLMAMKLYDEKVLNLDRRLSHYYPKLRKSNKKEFTVREVMAHEARLQSFIPFHTKIQTDTLKPLSERLARHYSIKYPHRIADGLYGREDLPDIIIDSIIKSNLLVTKGYKYSDLGFILLAKAFEGLTDAPMNAYLSQNFYARLGLTTMGYHPRDRFALERIAPTEYDKTFRRQIIHGDVHDQTAALLGGAAGHAGLFSDALDVAIILQMLMQNGEYGGDRYLDSTTVAEFTKTQFPIRGNRRGAGFDKPPLNPSDPSPASALVSQASFGHSGFTGTYFWVDPAEQLVYVFLSNRVYPDAENNKLAKMNIRTNVHELIYEALKKDNKLHVVQK